MVNPALYCKNWSIVCISCKIPAFHLLQRSDLAYTVRYLLIFLKKIYKRGEKQIPISYKNSSQVNKQEFPLTNINNNFPFWLTLANINMQIAHSSHTNTDHPIYSTEYSATQNTDQPSWLFDLITSMLFYSIICLHTISPFV